MLLHQTTSLCRTCKNAIPAQVEERAGAVWMSKRCAAHGLQEVLLSDDAGWYERTRAIRPKPNPPPRAPKPVALGCPFDCGACEAHEQKNRLPIATITSACNLDCPICYVHNKNDGAYHMSLADFGRILDHLLTDTGGDIDLLNLTGGDPTMHPHLFELLELAHSKGIHRLSICTNGIRLVKEPGYIERLARLGVRIALSFDSFEAEADYQLQGATLVELKLRCLDLLEKHGVNTTLIPVMTKGVNDREVGRIVAEGLRRPNVRHIEIHTITYTGMNGVSFDPERKGRISAREVLVKLEETTSGLLRVSDFVPSPAAHPLCYQVAYLLLDPAGGAPVPYTRFMPRETLYECLGDHLYMEPGPRLEAAFHEAINRLFSEGGPDSERVLALLRGLIEELFPRDRALSPAERLALAERRSKAVYLHTHMDEDTFDVERLAQCCDSDCFPDGTSIPVCAHNVLYRETEAQFVKTPVVRAPLAGGRRLPVLVAR